MDHSNARSIERGSLLRLRVSLPTFSPQSIQFTSLSLAARSLYNLESYNDNTLTCHKNKYFDIAYHLHAYALETTNPAWHIQLYDGIHDKLCMSHSWVDAHPRILLCLFFFVCVCCSSICTRNSHAVIKNCTLGLGIHSRECTIRYSLKMQLNTCCFYHRSI